MTNLLKSNLDMVERDDTVATNDNADLSGKNFTCPLVLESQNVENIQASIPSNASVKVTKTNEKFDWTDEQIGYVTWGS